MASVRRAVIDVGTNSIKLLVADVQGGTVAPVWEDSEQTRLGAGFFATNRLRPEAVEQSAQAVAGFATKARELNAVSTRVIATSAARDAVNPQELTSAIERTAGLKVEIISGEQEAEWAFKGVSTDAELARRPLLLMDVGGGSTEFILGEKKHKKFARSVQLGAVRLMEHLPHSDPPKPDELVKTREFVRDFLNAKVRKDLHTHLETMRGGTEKTLLVGVGGTATILARMTGQLASYDRARIEGMHIQQSQIHGEVKRLWSLPLAERKNVVGLPKTRADIILTGVVIYEVVMEVFGFSELCISTRGIRFAAVMD